MLKIIVYELLTERICVYESVDIQDLDLNNHAIDAQQEYNCK